MAARWSGRRCRGGRLLCAPAPPQPPWRYQVCLLGRACRLGRSGGCTASRHNTGCQPPASPALCYASKRAGRPGSLVRHDHERVALLHHPRLALAHHHRAHVPAGAGEQGWQGTGPPTSLRAGTPGAVSPRLPAAGPRTQRLGCPAHPSQPQPPPVAVNGEHASRRPGAAAAPPPTPLLSPRQPPPVAVHDGHAEGRERVARRRLDAVQQLKQRGALAGGVVVVVEWVGEGVAGGGAQDAGWQRAGRAHAARRWLCTLPLASWPQPTQLSLRLQPAPRPAAPTHPPGTSRTRRPAPCPSCSCPSGLAGGGSRGGQWVAWLRDSEGQAGTLSLMFLPIRPAGG